MSKRGEQLTSKLKGAVEQLFVGAGGLAATAGWVATTAIFVFLETGGDWNDSVHKAEFALPVALIGLAVCGLGVLSRYLRRRAAGDSRVRQPAFLLWGLAGGYMLQTGARPAVSTMVFTSDPTPYYWTLILAGGVALTATVVRSVQFCFVERGPWEIVSDEPGPARFSWTEFLVTIPAAALQLAGVAGLIAVVDTGDPWLPLVRFGAWMLTLTGTLGLLRMYAHHLHLRGRRLLDPPARVWPLLAAFVAFCLVHPVALQTLAHSPSDSSLMLVRTVSGVAIAPYLLLLLRWIYTAGWPEENASPPAERV